MRKLPGSLKPSKNKVVRSGVAAARETLSLQFVWLDNLSPDVFSILDVYFVYLSGFLNVYDYCTRSVNGWLAELATWKMFFNFFPIIITLRIALCLGRRRRRATFSVAASVVGFYLLQHVLHLYI